MFSVEFGVFPADTLGGESLDSFLIHQLYRHNPNLENRLLRTFFQSSSHGVLDLLPIQTMLLLEKLHTYRHRSKPRVALSAALSNIYGIHLPTWQQKKIKEVRVALLFLVCFVSLCSNDGSCAWAARIWSNAIIRLRIGEMILMLALKTNKGKVLHIMMETFKRAHIVFTRAAQYIANSSLLQHWVLEKKSKGTKISAMNLLQFSTWSQIAEVAVFVVFHSDSRKNKLVQD